MISPSVTAKSAPNNFLCSEDDGGGGAGGSGEGGGIVGVGAGPRAQVRVICFAECESELE